MAPKATRKINRPYSTKSWPLSSYQRRFIAQVANPVPARQRSANGSYLRLTQSTLQRQLRSPWCAVQPCIEGLLRSAGQARRGAAKHGADATGQAFHRGDRCQGNQKQKQSVFNQVLSFVFQPKP